MGVCIASLQCRRFAVLFVCFGCCVCAVSVCVSLRLVTYSWRLQGARLNWSQIYVAHFGRSFSNEDSAFSITGATTNGSVPLVWLKIRRGITSSRGKVVLLQASQDLATAAPAASRDAPCISP